MDRAEIRENMKWARRVHKEYKGPEQTLIQLLASALRDTSEQLLKISK